MAEKKTEAAPESVEDQVERLVNARLAEIEAKGADVVQEPIDQPYGVRDCAFRDPAGNFVRINQAIA